MWNSSPKDIVELESINGCEKLLGKFMKEAFIKEY